MALVQQTALVGLEIDLADIAGQLRAVAARDAHIPGEDGDVAGDVVNRLVAARNIAFGDDGDMAVGGHFP